ncbi:hypothetical protein Tco_1032498 [Tanacetum coccineum]|uniref:Uncharacterized protein n=1 Tax=Tanacetum coccineum TaxID=301880 RepID=A0ABQ5GE47_9ASTR
MQRRFGENVEMLMQGSVGLFNKRKGRLFDEYGTAFVIVGNESIHDYFVRFHKLVNDMKITQLNIPTHQMNTKFVNNLPAYWGKYVTNVKQNMESLNTLCSDLYSSQSLRASCKKGLSRNRKEQSTSIVDPLAYDHATVHDGHIVTEPVQRKAPGNVGNTGARGKKVICYNCRGEGHVLWLVVKKPRRKLGLLVSTSKISFTDEAKEKGDVLDADA